MVVTVTNIKGGCGKTTTAVALATAAARDGFSVRLIDADQQGSATLWAASAEDDGTPLPFPSSAGNAATLARLRAPAGEVVVVDCPPQGPVTEAAKAAADFVVVPTSAGGLDMQQTWATVQSLEAAGKPYAVLLVRAKARTVALSATLAELEGQGASYFDTVIPEREQIRNAFGAPFAALHGYDGVWEEIEGATGLGCEAE